MSGVFHFVRTPWLPEKRDGQPGGQRGKQVEDSWSGPDPGGRWHHLGGPRTCRVGQCVGGGAAALQGGQTPSNGATPSSNGSPGPQ